MTALKSLALNLVMLLVAAGVLFWVLQEGSDVPSEPPVAAGSETASVRQSSIPVSDQSESEGENPEPERFVQNQNPTPAVSSTATLHASAATRATSAKTTAPARRPVTFPLDLNTAKLEDFVELPGIGEKLAQRLMDYRQSHGRFRSVEDLREVRGIGAKRFERLRPLVVTAAAP